MNTQEQPLHVTIAVKGWKNYRVFRTCSAFQNYLKAILAKGYTGFWTDVVMDGKYVRNRTSDINTLCEQTFDMGIVLLKGQDKIVIYETERYSRKPVKSSKKTVSKKKTTTLSEPVFF